MNITDSPAWARLENRGTTESHRSETGIRRPVATAMVAFVLSLPFILYQAWSFVTVRP